ncbi:MAG TPA: sigma-54 dependent transcriptional regulator [Polyangiaceae bacterium]|nr:sigma-54 dependent transcriptional regulator [Polyangiaceae bacterium]
MERQRKRFERKKPSPDERARAGANGIGPRQATPCAINSTMPGQKRQIDIVLEPVMRSAAMRELDKIIRAVAAKDVGITIVGESGTGKEVLARRVHDLSDRRTGPFVPINCAAIPESLFESELFGHERGAFTGANERARGKVEASAGGTLFLDEIGEMPTNVQAKLLRFLESRKFMRVGGSTKISVDARLVCATLRSLETEVEAGRFRADLYYRIQGVTLQVPALRDRPADIAPLVQQFIAELSAKHSLQPPKMTRAASAALRNYDWPGNVRELRNVLELVCLLRAAKAVRVQDLPPALRRHAVENERPSVGRTSGNTIEIGLDQKLSEILERVMLAVLQVEGGNRSRAARRLGISLRTVQRHLARHPP